LSEPQADRATALNAIAARTWTDFETNTDAPNGDYANMTRFGHEPNLIDGDEQKVNDE
jgi:hypothetical protein